MGLIGATGSGGAPCDGGFVRSHPNSLELVSIFEGLTHQVVHLKERIHNRSLPVDDKGVAGEIWITGKRWDLRTGTGSDGGDRRLKAHAAGDYGREQHG